MVKKVLNQINRKHSWLTWPILAGATLLLFNLIPYQSQFIETYFSRGLFRLFRIMWDHSFGFLPIPNIYLLIIGCIYYLSLIRKKNSCKSRFLNLSKRFVILGSFLLICFYWCWGFNYKRIDVRQTLGLTKAQMSVNDLYDEYERVTDSLDALRTVITAQGTDLTDPISERSLRSELEQLYTDISLPNTGRVRVRRIRPKGALLHISTSGVYLPFVGEGHIDAGLHPLTHPFTMMHEMSHGYGWTGEDVCNFLALLGTVRSKDPVVRYSGYMGYWRYLRSNAYHADKQRFKTVEIVISEAVKKDYNDVLDYQDRYPDFLPKLRDLFYDNYLKAHGIPDGLTNYSAIVTLAHAWQQKHGDLTNDPS